MDLEKLFYQEVLSVMFISCVILNKTVSFRKWNVCCSSLSIIKVIGLMYTFICLMTEICSKNANKVQEEGIKA
jgi:hypothetical protein